MSYVIYGVVALVYLGFIVGTDDQSDPLLSLGMVVCWPLMVPVTIGCYVGRKAND